MCRPDHKADYRVGAILQVFTFPFYGWTKLAIVTRAVASIKMESFPGQAWVAIPMMKTFRRSCVKREEKKASAPLTCGQKISGSASLFEIETK